MPRSYRGIIIAVFGWLILCAQHPNPTSKPEEAKADSRIGDSLANIAATYRDEAKRGARPPERQPCGPNQYQGSDDLCAQWKAADAAASAAWWARISGVLSIAGLFGVAGALILTIRSNDIARDTARRQLRAYLSVTLVGYSGLIKDTGDFPCFSVEVRNNGTTPAYDYQSHFKCYIAPANHVPSLVDLDKLYKEMKYVLGPSVGNIVKNRPITIDPAQRASFLLGESALFIEGAFIFRDCFDQWHYTNLLYRSKGIDHPGAVIAIMENEQTIQPERWYERLLQKK